MVQLSLKIVTIGISFVLLAGTLFPVGGQTNIQKTLDSQKIILNLSESTVRVGDIDISYKIFGKGDPIILINGLAGSIDTWDPLLIEILASNYSVIVFNNRGIGNTTSGQESFSIEQFAIDTVGLLNTLNISKTHVLGHSMGGMIALELALMHPERVNKLIISSSFCGKSASISNYIDKQKIQSNWSGSPQERIEKLIPFLFPKEWREQNLNILNTTMITTEMSSSTWNEQSRAISDWKGVCNQLKNLIQPTLIIGGFYDAIINFNNLLILAGNIPNASIVGFNGAGHGYMYQYPNEVSSFILSFLKEKDSEK